MKKMINIWYGLKRLWSIIKPVEIQYKLLEPSANVPTKAYKADGGFDIYATETITIEPRQSVNVSCGIAIQVPEGYKYYVRGRSSLNKVRIKVSTGLIDSHFNNILYALMDSLTDSAYVINKGDKIAQISIHYNPDLPWVEVKEFKTPKGSRGSNGFGSSGK